MTLAMPDSINVNNLPPGYSAYLGYVDGRWPTAARLVVKFPMAQLVLLTVVRSTTVTAAHGVRISSGADVEPGDLSALSASAWVGHKLHAEPTSRPVLYASVSAMPEVIGELAFLRVERSQVRLLSAHYGEGPHICGPDSCGQVNIKMDGTQWTDQWVGAGGAPVDMSMLADDFFTGSTGLNQTERLVQELGTVRQGDQGEAVRTVQALCNARAQHGGSVPILAIDGMFGEQTDTAVRFEQHKAGLATDGIVGSQTWAVLLGVA